jgi:hypothetical protein
MSNYTDKYVVFNEKTKTCRYLKSSDVTFVGDEGEFEYFCKYNERLVEVVPSFMFYCLKAREFSIREYKRIFLTKIAEAVITGKDAYIDYVSNEILSFDYPLLIGLQFSQSNHGINA